MRISRRRFQPKKPSVVYMVNENIRFPEVRVIHDTEGHVGVMPTADALQKAREQGFDLVVIQANAVPPIAKIIDFGKYKYEKEKEARKAKAKAKTVEVKGIRLSARIGEHDLMVRKEQAKKFLERGDKLKIEIFLRGREKRHGDLAAKIIQEFVADLNKEMPLKVEQPVSRMGGQLTSIVGKA
ncbi:translation initiation factor IF-3 [Candidatus Uhrbacteria bacterium]|nr:translation initiation factor IF-3 [Candidatus Uhrbacteria bacterium]